MTIKIARGRGASVSFDGERVVVEEWVTEVSHQDWSFLEPEQLDAMNADISSSVAHGVELTLGALLKAGLLDRNDPRLPRAFAELYKSFQAFAVI